jgi:microcin C transport system permease protein
MYAYLRRRLALIPLTLLGIIAINFAIVQIAPRRASGAVAGATPAYRRLRNRPGGRWGGGRGGTQRAGWAKPWQ